ncbi:MAG: hypothetical protein J7L45_02500 [Candidatus Aenigmarchaeota archaeon]|nr:hypothetical protein [Candidatus Aenigmarchaeota archaeon]
MAGYPVEVGEKEVTVAGIDLPISTKNSVIVCRKINKMTLEKAKRFLVDLIEKKTDINGKHYTKTAKEILKILESGEKNAEYRGIENPVIKTISAERGPTKRRRRRTRFGNKMKSTHIKLVLREGKK